MSYFDNIELKVANLDFGSHSMTPVGHYRVNVTVYFNNGNDFVTLGELPVVLPQEDTMTVADIKSQAIEKIKEILGEKYPIGLSPF